MRCSAISTAFLACASPRANAWRSSTTCRADTQIIDEALIELGFHLDNSLLNKLLRALHYYSEEAQCANLGYHSHRSPAAAWTSSSNVISICRMAAATTTGTLGGVICSCR